MNGADLELEERDDTIEGGDTGGGGDTVVLPEDDGDEFVMVDADENGDPVGQGRREDIRERDTGTRGEGRDDERSRLPRSARRKLARERDRNQNMLLAERLEDALSQLADLKTKVNGNTVASIDERLEQSVAEYREAEEAIAGGATGKDLVKALRQRDLALRTAERLEAEKSGVAKETPARTATRGADPVVMNKARGWLNENAPWYSTDRRDEDSGIVRAIDNALLAEGFNPRSDEYYEELTDRVRERLPHRFKAPGRGRERDDDQDFEERPRRPAAREGGQARDVGRRAPPVGGGGGGGRTEVYISPARRDALQQAGAFDDPAKMKRLLKAYALQDKEARRRG